ncbi:hypothetical protein GCM10009550_20880 [Actinocorallia libanotica]|uniref:Uncharacterized protein n=1 Tax=Actinocorallia libanotica TaxID=46162 RepID=A0ABP4BBK1_9ACTN
MGEQFAEKSPVLRGGGGDRAPLVRDLERAQYAELHNGILPFRLNGFQDRKCSPASGECRCVQTAAAQCVIGTGHGFFTGVPSVVEQADNSDAL